MKSVRLLDGGLGQELQKRSKRPPHPLWSVQVMREEPALVQAVHEDFIRSGARLLTLNTYAATPARLRRDGESGWLAPTHELALSSAMQARDASGCPHGPVHLLGCLPPLVGSYDAQAVPSSDECARQYRVMVEAQAGVDGFICETLSTIVEGRMAAEVALEAGRPVWLSFSIMDDGSNRLRSGESVEAMVEAVRDLPVQALLLNCSTPEAIGKALPLLAESGKEFGAYANGFETVEPLKPGGTVDALTARRDLDPEAYAETALAWHEMGATVLGGCCEVGPGHISRLHERLQERETAVIGLEESK